MVCLCFLEFSFLGRCGCVCVCVCLCSQGSNHCNYLLVTCNMAMIIASLEFGNIDDCVDIEVKQSFSFMYDGLSFNVTFGIFSAANDNNITSDRTTNDNQNQNRDHAMIAASH